MIAPIGWHEIAGMTPLMVLIVAIGVFPRPFLNQIRPAVARIDAEPSSPARLGEPAERKRRRLSDRADRVAGKAGGAASRSSKTGGQPKGKSAKAHVRRKRPRHQPRRPPSDNSGSSLPDANSTRRSGHESLECS